MSGASLPQAVVGEDKRRRVRASVSRPSSPSSRFHMSSRAVDQQFLKYATMTERQAMHELARIRWGGHRSMPCPMCGTIDAHPWNLERENWRCASCKKFFSVTTGTLLEGRKRELRHILLESYAWSCGASGIPALTIRALIGAVSYNSSFSLVQKLREGLVRGHNTGLISGVVEIDGAHASGHRAAEKRGRPLGGWKRSAEEEALVAQSIVDAFNAKQARKRASSKSSLAATAQEAVTTPSLDAPGVVRDPTYGTVYPESRRIVITLRRRTGNAGMGAMWTRVGVGLAETPEVVEALVRRHVLVPESILATDSGTAFSKVGKEFKLHLVVNHSETMVGPNGEHVNLAESFTARQDRAEGGIYLNIEPKYLHDYACETAFREDHRQLSAGKKVEKLLFWALNVGESHYWRGYTHGQHRDYEHLVPERRRAKASGPAPQRWSTSANRPPR